MITFFTTAKPFVGHIGVTQRNALKSWTLLDPDAKVILFGDEQGAAEVCAELGILHKPYVERSQINQRLPVANFLFRQAQEITRHEWFCYLNCDIILTADFCDAVRRLCRWREAFLMVGMRWDMDIAEPLDFDRPNWAMDLRGTAVERGTPRDREIDYFLFRKGMYWDMPPLIIGRIYWDYWMIWKALAEGLPVVEASPMVVAVHQNHETAYVREPKKEQGVFIDPGAAWNYRLADDGKHLATFDNCTHRLYENGLLLPTVWRKQRRRARQFLWEVFVHKTYGIRKRMGLHRGSRFSHNK